MQRCQEGISSKVQRRFGQDGLDLGTKSLCPHFRFNKGDPTALTRVRRQPILALRLLGLQSVVLAELANKGLGKKYASKDCAGFRFGFKA
jgi:hypothetical protein